MNYSEAVDYLYSATPQFQQIGAAAYKPGLDTVRALARWCGDPQMAYPTIHVGGTNGKGSTAHTLAAILQSAGYRVGLYTSPHLVDFRERIRVDGRMIPEAAVAEFVDRYVGSEAARTLSPSFFELTTVMAFDWFAKMNVDVAVIEVGLGGRLDSTNIICPELSVITNISLDHMAQLGDTPLKIASEKAGIIKEGVPFVCGESDPALKSYFSEVADRVGAPSVFADDRYRSLSFGPSCGDTLEIKGTPSGTLSFALTGECQKQNARTILAAVDVLRELPKWEISDEAVRAGFRDVCTLTSLMGRWMKVGDKPLTVCDTGHNIGGWELLSGQLADMPRPLTVVLGFVNDKDTSHIFPLLPRDAKYIFTQASIPRALPAQELASRACSCGITGECIVPVGEAVRRAREITPSHGSVFVGGSTFVVADLLADLKDF